jgi:5'-phosphate synthase pdxT subunit
LSSTFSQNHRKICWLTCIPKWNRVKRKPTWGTCAGLILLAESANKTKKGGQELIGGIDVRVNRNHFGRQVESFAVDINLPFLHDLDTDAAAGPFHAVFIRAPVVEKTLPHVTGIQTKEAERDDTVVAPSRKPEETVPENVLNAEVEIMATLPSSVRRRDSDGKGDIIAVKQGNCFGTSFHPELTNDPRIHIWWLKSVLKSMKR